MANREPSIATFIFTDIVDSTKIHDSLGDEGAQEILRVHNALMRAEIARHGGSEIKTMGDGFEIVFRSVTPALACAVDVQRAIARHNEEHPARKFMVRMGIHVGEAIEEEINNRCREEREHLTDKKPADHHQAQRLPEFGA